MSRDYVAPPNQGPIPRHGIQIAKDVDGVASRQREAAVPEDRGFDVDSRHLTAYPKLSCIRVGRTLQEVHE
jgi:hypothetical protein